MKFFGGKMFVGFLILSIILTAVTGNFFLLLIGGFGFGGVSVWKNK